MAYVSKIDAARQLKLISGDTAVLSGNTYIMGGFTGGTHAQFIGTVQGFDAVNNDEFITKGQLNSYALDNNVVHLTGYTDQTIYGNLITTGYTKSLSFASNNGLSGLSAKTASFGYEVGGGTPSLDLYVGSDFTSYRMDKVLFSDGTNTVSVNRPPTLSNNDIYWPDKSGTVALLSDITTGYVPYTGATSNVDLGVNDITAQAFHTNPIGGHTLSIFGSNIQSNDNHISIFAQSGTFIETNTTIRVPIAPVGATDVVRLQDLTGATIGYVPYSGASNTVQLNTQLLSGTDNSGKTYNLSYDGFNINRETSSSIGISIKKADLSSYVGLANNFLTIGDNTGYMSLYRDKLIYNSGSTSLSLLFPILTGGTVTQTIQPKSGTVALLSDLTGATIGYIPYTGATGTVDLNTQQMNAGNFGVIGSGNYTAVSSDLTHRGILENQGLTVYNTNPSLNSGSTNYGRNSFSYNNGTYGQSINFTNPTTGRTISFPDKSGIVALISDLTGYTETSTLDDVTTRGNVTTNDIKIKSPGTFQFMDSGGTMQYSMKIDTGNLFKITNASGGTIFQIDQSGNISGSTFTQF